MAVLYDTIGSGYAELRQADPHIEAALHAALGPARSILNVGAGAGSYEPADRDVVAVEISNTMISQRAPDAAPVVQASATALPFSASTFDAALAILTLHHWPDRAQGLRELRRVARDRVVILTWDPAFPGFWLTDYFPQIMEIDRPIFPPMQALADILGPVDVNAVPIPHDCRDGFMCAYWRRPEAYLDARVRSAISTFAKIDVETALARLAVDLQSGEWHRRNADILERQHLDLGYRLVVARA